MSTGKAIVIAAALLGISYLLANLHIVRNAEMKTGESTVPTAYVINVITGSTVFCQPSICSALEIKK